MTKSKITLENEEDIGGIPLQKKPILTPHEEMFFELHYGGWIMVQLQIKRIEGIAKHGKNEFKKLGEAKNSIRARDRYFLHKFVPPEMFEDMEIQHFWHDNMSEEYDYCCIWTRNENQVIELRRLKKMGWKVEEMAYAIEKVFLEGRDEGSI